MIDYSQIDPELFRWAATKGYTVQTRYRDDEIRSFEIWSDNNQSKSEIGISNIDNGHVEITVFDGKKQRERMESSLYEIVNLLDRAERLALQWIGK